MRDLRNKEQKLQEWREKARLVSMYSKHYSIEETANYFRVFPETVLKMCNWVNEHP